MGWKSKLLLGLVGLSGYEQYKKDLERKGEDMSMKNAYEFFGKPAVDKIVGFGSGVIKGGKEYLDKNEGGMAYARKKNMGLKMKKGGSLKSKKSKKKSRGTGAAKRGTKFKGTF